jgi:type I restriction enzyme M protein
MNPPFSLKDWGSESFTDGDPFERFGYGSPPADNGDYAWMQHVAKSLKPDGRAIVVMSQGTFDTNTIDKAVRPERHPKDPLRSDFDKVNAALKSGLLGAFVSEIVISPQYSPQTVVVPVWA